MENHVFKPHYRHGHHHHKNQTFYALLSMTFFGLIALGVVASIYYTLGQEEPSNTGNAAGTCLVGTVDCVVDTPFNPPPPMDERYALLQSPSKTATTYTNTDAGYEVEIPPKMAVTGFSGFDISIGPLEEKWNLALTVAPNATNMTLEEAYQSLVDQMILQEETPYEDQYTISDVKSFNMRVDGVPARRFSIDNFGDVGETVIVALNGDYIYVIRGSTGQDWNTPDNDVLNFAASFQFLE